MQRYLLVFTCVFGSCLFAFENAKVLPKGVRNLDLRSVRTDLSQKYDGNKNLHMLSEPLAKEFTFEKVLKKEKGTKKVLLGAFLQDHFNLDESLGIFSADLKGSVAVTVPIFSYGVTEKLTLALAVPYYQAKMAVGMGFTPSKRAQDFVNELHSEKYNQTQSAQEAADKVNNAVGELNKKLRENQFATLSNWKGQGIGDTTLAAKYSLYEKNILRLSTTNGAILPTGKVDDPDNLIDIPFGTGSWNLFTGVNADQNLREDLFINQFVKFSYSGNGKRTVRLNEPDESIEVKNQRMRYKLGDQWEGGASIQYEPSYGLLCGLGWTYWQKYSDRYNVPGNMPEVKSTLQKDTAQTAHHAEARLGYSTVPAYKRGEVPLPAFINLDYKKQLVGTNTPVKDMITVDVNLFF